MARVRVKMYTEQINALGDPGKPLFLKWLRLCLQIDQRMKFLLSNQMVNVRTGNLRSSQQPPVIVHRGDRIIGIFTNTASYAAAVHNGSAPHRIVPVNAKVLAFTVGGGFEGPRLPHGAAVIGHAGSSRNNAAGQKTRGSVGVQSAAQGNLVFSRGVNHPGTRPRPWMVTAAEEVIRSGI